MSHVNDNNVIWLVIYKGLIIRYYIFLLPMNNVNYLE